MKLIVSSLKYLSKTSEVENSVMLSLQISMRSRCEDDSLLIFVDFLLLFWAGRGARGTFGRGVRLRCDGSGGAHLRRAALPVLQHGLLQRQNDDEHDDDDEHADHGLGAVVHPARLLLQRRHDERLHQPVRSPQARRPHRRHGSGRSHRSHRDLGVSHLSNLNCWLLVL